MGENPVSTLFEALTDGGGGVFVTPLVGDIV
jgi:hypothetical protein